jgi:hypothetical protein
MPSSHRTGAPLRMSSEMRISPIRRPTSIFEPRREDPDPADLRAGGGHCLCMVTGWKAHCLRFPIIRSGGRFHKNISHPTPQPWGSTTGRQWSVVRLAGQRADRGLFPGGRHSFIECRAGLQFIWGSIRLFHGPSTAAGNWLSGIFEEADEAGGSLLWRHQEQRWATLRG